MEKNKIKNFNEKIDLYTLNKSIDFIDNFIEKQKAALEEFPLEFNNLQRFHATIATFQDEKTQLEDKLKEILKIFSNEQLHITETEKKDIEQLIEIRRELNKQLPKEKGAIMAPILARQEETAKKKQEQPPTLTKKIADAALTALTTFVAHLPNQ